METEPRQYSFDQKKTHFFSDLASSLKSIFQIHKRESLWEKTPEGKRDWGNVSEHCLVEAARAREFAELLGFSPDQTRLLLEAAAVHDFHKKFETVHTKQHGKVWDSFGYSDEVGEEKLRQVGFSDELIEIAGSVGHGSFLDMDEIVTRKNNLSDQDILRLIMHYLDDYTTGAEWTEAAFQDDSGQWRNDLDKRIAKNHANKNYETLNEEGRQKFDGQLTFDMQLKVGKQIEQILARLIEERSGQKVAPYDIPFVIDQKIRQKIEAITF